MESDKDIKQEELKWFAMRATYRREITAKTFLETNGVECFVPMQKKIKQLRARKVQVFEPVLHNLVFAHTSKEKIQFLKTKVEYLQYMTILSEGRRVPMIVPDYQMDAFKRVCETYNDGLLYLDPATIDLQKGTHVRIHGGVFDGLEGTFMKIEGKRNKRIVIQVQNLIAVALSYVDPDFIEVIK